MFLKQEIKILCIILAEAQTQEKESLQNLQHLIHMTCESLGLWKVICDHQFHVVASALTKVRMIKFCTVVFEHHYRPQVKGANPGGWADPPRGDTMGYGQEAGGTHPPGIHSCFLVYLKFM